MSAMHRSSTAEKILASPQILDTKGRIITRVDATLIEAFAKGAHAPTQRELVDLARKGQLKGVVSKPARYSATTIQWHADCARKFYWPTVAGLEDPPSSAQAFGTTLHAMAEAWLKSGAVPPLHRAEGQLLNVGLPLLPAPKSKGLYVEDPFTVKFKGIPVDVTGTIDLHQAPAAGAHVFMLGDHKTARSATRFVKTKPWLHDNIQANLYAKVLADKWRALGHEIKLVDKQWFYYYKEERRADRLRVVQEIENIDEQFETIITPNILGMARIAREAPKVTDIPAADRSICEMYKGCPHLARCFGMGAKEDSKMGVLSGGFSKQNIAAKAAALKATKPAAGINPPKAKLAPVMEELPESEEDVAAAEAAAQEREEQEAAEAEALNAEAQAEAEAEAAEAEKAAKKAKPARAAKGAKVKVDDDEAPAQTPRGSSRSPGANSEHDFWLLVGTTPLKGFSAAPIAIEEIVGSAQANAAASLGTDHYRQGNSYGVLETAFASWMEENAIKGAVFVADPTTLVARDVIGLLRAHASVVLAAVK